MKRQILSFWASSLMSCLVCTAPSTPPMVPALRQRERSAQVCPTQPYDDLPFTLF